MLEHRIARELAAVVKDGAPKGFHSIKVVRPVIDPFSEDRAKHIVVANLGVKELNQGADEFLGTQGYAWDTQADMAFALLGAVLALLLFSRWHDRQICQLASTDV
mgnify:CR=1 FL=1